MFCDGQQPVNQTAENIIFSQNDDGTVTAVVQILYQGPSERFAWLLPVNGAPEVGVSSNNAIQRLVAATNPRFDLVTTVEGTCKEEPLVDFEDGVASAPEADAATNEDSGVTVVDQGTVGPYDYTTLSISPDAADPAQAAVDWLTQNNYDLMGTGPDLIRDYLEDGMNLIAFKLTKNASSGDIRPVTLTYDADLPMIPIKLTAVAANDDMGVRVWVLGDERAIPSNYKSLELNFAAINWLQRGANYNQVVTLAADEASGQGFVTEFADSSDTVDEVVWADREETSWQTFREPTQWAAAHGDLLVESVNRYRGFDGLLRTVDATVPLPDGVTAAQFIALPWDTYDSSDTTIAGFAPEVFLDSLEANVIAPMQETEALMGSQPYMSRLYTTMSAREMTIDPVFDFNAQLTDVDNVHEAQRTIYCSELVTRSEAPWKTVLPDGKIVHGVGNTWPIRATDGAPATETIRQDTPMGEGEVVEDNAEVIDAILAENNDAISLEPADYFDGFDETSRDQGEPAGCSAPAGSTPSPTWSLVGIAIAGALLRRRSTWQR